MKKITFALLFAFVSIATFAQNDTLNYMDANGKKQGHWIQKYANGKTKFEGYFKNILKRQPMLILQKTSCSAISIQLP